MNISEDCSAAWIQVSFLFVSFLSSFYKEPGNQNKKHQILIHFYCFDHFSLHK